MQNEIDKLQEQLNRYFPDQVKPTETELREILEEMKIHDISMERLDWAIRIVKQVFPQNKRDLLGQIASYQLGGGGLDVDLRERLHQFAVIRFILEATHESYWLARKPPYGFHRHIDDMETLRGELAQFESQVSSSQVLRIARP